ncbi:hypothetical protein [Mesorhizobium sp. CAU 1732]|uniref:hypothetical protein n=1 Tax=Mesorhizobium sp. CAU 1732 TaxID=3140358 RepID=UPI0032605A93
MRVRGFAGAMIRYPFKMASRMLAGLSIFAPSVAEMDNALLDIATIAPDGRVPLYLDRFRIDVVYFDSFSGGDGFKDHRKVMQGAFRREMEAAWKLGFFAWSFFDRRDEAKLDFDWSRQGKVSLIVGAAGLHHNVLVAMIRMIFALHHTPLAAYQEARVTLGEFADQLPPRTLFQEIVQSVQVMDMHGADERMAQRDDLLDFVRDDEIQLPLAAGAVANVTQENDGNRMVVAPATSGFAFPAGKFSKTEDIFLRLCDNTCFRDVSALDQEGSIRDAEMFMRQASSGAELVIDDYLHQNYGLLELLNCLSGGNIDKLVPKVDRG